MSSKKKKQNSDQKSHSTFGMIQDYTLNDTYKVTNRFFAVFSKWFKILIRNFQESEKNISDEF